MASSLWHYGATAKERRKPPQRLSTPSTVDKPHRCCHLANNFESYNSRYLSMGWDIPPPKKKFPSLVHPAVSLWHAASAAMQFMPVSQSSVVCRSIQTSQDWTLIDWRFSSLGHHRLLCSVVIALLLCQSYNTILFIQDMCHYCRLTYIQSVNNIR